MNNEEKKINELKEYIFDICDIIYMECPLEEQDGWVKEMAKKGLYDEESTTFPRLPHTCCRNGCGKCER